MPRKSWLGWWMFALCTGCGGDADAGNSTPGEVPQDEVDASAPMATKTSVDASAPLPVGLDPDSAPDDAARSICGLAPWVLSNLPFDALSKDKVSNLVREDLATFGQDKPPICVDTAESTQNLCDEMPSGTKTFTYLYRTDGANPSDPVEQVWCKSDSYDDLVRIPGMEGATRGSCEQLHDLIVEWARAQLLEPTERSIRYQAVVHERGSAWLPALVETSEDGTVLTVRSPELYAPTKVEYVAQFGTDALPFLTDAFFGNQYCKLISPARALAWLSGP